MVIFSVIKINFKKCALLAEINTLSVLLLEQLSCCNMTNIHQTFKRPQVFVTLSCFSQGGQNDCLTKESSADRAERPSEQTNSSESLLYNQMTFHTSPLNVVTVAKARKLYPVITAAEGHPCQCDFPSQFQ